MTISSLFTSNERLFAEWMMQHEFNQEIQAEPRFPGENQDLAIESYYTIQEKSCFVMPNNDQKEADRMKRLTLMQIPLKEDEKEAIRKREEASLRRNPIPEYKKSFSTSDNVEMYGTGRQNRTAPKQKPIYQIVHGPVVQKVEKNLMSKM